MRWFRDIRDKRRATSNNSKLNLPMVSWRNI